MTSTRLRRIAARAVLALAISQCFWTLACAVDEPQPAPPATKPGAPATQPARPAEKPGSPPGAAPTVHDAQALRGHSAATAAYRFLLEAVVTETGLVRYDKLVSPMNMEMLTNIVRLYGQTDLPEDRNERMAVLCNAYNTNVMLMALNESRKSGFKNVLGVKGFFDEKLITIGGEPMTLNDVLKKLRPMGDPRIHAALVCAAMSSPPLRREPYVASRLDAQLDDQCRRWINDPARNHLESTGAALSMILDWFNEDFNVKPYNDRLGFVLKFAEPESPIALYLKSAEKPVILWEPFDWTLNAAPALTPAIAPPAPNPAPDGTPPAAPATSPPAAPAADPARPTSPPSAPEPSKP